MVLKKRNANPSFINGGPQRKSIEPDDYWAFLEEIEAPMWVDLTLEVQSTDKDIEDAWFQTAHPFHQCSSHHLISMFSLSSEGKMKSPDLHHQHPKLPNSVSKSRGKHYKSRKWERGENNVISVDKQHPIRMLGGKNLRLVSGSNALHSNSTSSTLTSKSSRKLRTNSGDQTCSTDSKESRTAECSSTSTVTSKSSIRPKASFGEYNKTTSNYKVDMITEKTQHPIIPEARRTFGQTDGFLLAMRISLTKSCVTRHASRVEVKDDGLPKHRKSSLSKSSVGSSCNPGCNLENINHHGNRGAPKIRKDASSVQTTNNKGNSLNVSKKTFSGRLRDSSNLMTKWGGKAIATKHDYRDCKAKIIHSTAPRKPMRLHNAADPFKERVTARSKVVVGSSKCNRVTGGGKENNAADINQNQTATTHTARVKDGNGLTDPTGKLKGETQQTSLTEFTSDRNPTTIKSTLPVDTHLNVYNLLNHRFL